MLSDSTGASLRYALKVAVVEIEAVDVHDGFQVVSQKKQSPLAAARHLMDEAAREVVRELRRGRGHESKLEKRHVETSLLTHNTIGHLDVPPPFLAFSAKNRRARYMLV